MVNIVIEYKGTVKNYRINPIKTGTLQNGKNGNGKNRKNDSVGVIFPHKREQDPLLYQ